MKTILHILNTGSFSGAENVVITIIRSFNIDKNYRSIYVSLDGTIRKKLNDEDIEFEPIKALSVKEIRRAIKKYLPDIIHAHDFTASIVCAFASGHIPVVSHVHSNPPWIKRICLKSMAYGLSCFKYKYMLGVSTSVFSEFVFGKYFKQKEKIVGNPVDILEIQSKAKKALNQEGYDLVFLGRMAPLKNPFLFLKIVSEVNNEIPVRAVMIGDGQIRDLVEEKIEDEGLQEVVTVKGFIENPYGILKNSKILCVTSQYEGFGLVAVEALALRIPVVAANVGGLKEIVTSSCGLICGTEKDYVNEIKKLLIDDKYYRNKSFNSLKRANELNNLNEYIDLMKQIYDEY